MNRAQIFPFIILTLNFCAALVYAFEGDVRRAVYWAAGAVITASVTF